LIVIEIVLTVCGVDGAICHFHNLCDLVLVILPGGKTYSYIRFGQSLSEGSGTVTGTGTDLYKLRFKFPTRKEFYVFLFYDLHYICLT
jgi:hypothetical protein